MAGAGAAGEERVLADEDECGHAESGESLAQQRNLQQGKRGALEVDEGLFGWFTLNFLLDRLGSVALPAAGSTVKIMKGK